MFIIRGKAIHVSREQIRAFLHASVTVLSYHNKTPRLPLDVTVSKTLHNMGEYHGNRNIVLLRANLNPEEMLTTCLHEVIHACMIFPEYTKEKCTSTLCAKLKSDVAKIAKLLLDGTYQRAAFIAHTKLTYRTTEDYYDGAEDHPIGVQTRYSRAK